MPPPLAPLLLLAASARGFVDHRVPRRPARPTARAPVAAAADGAVPADGPASTPVFDLVMAQNHGCALAVFAKVGLFDYLGTRGAEGASVAEIAARAGWSMRAASAMAISLTTNGMLAPAGAAGPSFEARYRLTETAERYLRTDRPGTVAPYLELFWECTPQQLLEKARADADDDSWMLDTGGGGAPSEMFINAMQAQSSHGASVLAPLLDLSGVTEFVDVAGGSGTLCREVCRANPEMRGTVYELAEVAHMVDQYTEREGMADAVRSVVGDMFGDDAFHPGDCYAFGNVLHDWDDATNADLLAKAYRSLPESGGRVVIYEMLLAEDVASTSRAASGLNLVMVTNERGRQYKASELGDMLRDAGFVDVSVVSSPATPYGAVVARKAPR